MRDKNQFFYTDEEWEERLKEMVKPLDFWGKVGWFIGSIYCGIVEPLGLDEYSQWKKTGKRRNK